MQVEKITLDDGNDLKRAFNITVNAGDIDLQVDEKLEQISKTLKMPGFRPGKVPMKLVKKNYKKNVMGEVLEDVVKKSSAEALAKEGLRPAVQPKIEVVDFSEGKDLKYKMEFEIMPDVPEMDFSKITIEKPTAETGDKEIDEAIGKIVENSKHFHAVKKDRAAKKGDAVLIDFKGFIDGEVFEGGEAENHQLELGSGNFIPGFEEQLIGLNKGDNKDVEVSFPEDYHAEHLAGKPVKFEVKIHEVQEVHVKKADDEFAKGLGLKDLADLKKSIKEQMDGEINQACRNIAKKELFDNLDEISNFSVPAEMVRLEFDSIWEQVKKAKEADPDSEEFKKSDDDLEKEYQKMAIRRVRLGILLSDLGHKNDIAVANNELQQAVMSEARRYPGQEAQVIEYYQQHPEHIEALKGPILEEKVVDFILEKVNVKEKKLSIEELRNLENE